MMERIAKRLQMRTKTSLAPLENLKIVKNSTKLLTDPFIENLKIVKNSTKLLTDPFTFYTSYPAAMSSSDV